MISKKSKNLIRKTFQVESIKEEVTNKQLILYLKLNATIFNLFLNSTNTRKSKSYLYHLKCGF